MRLRLPDRLLLLLEGLILIALVACLVLPYFGFDPLACFQNGIINSSGKVFGYVILGGIALICVLLAFYVFKVAFYRQKKQPANSFVLLANSDDRGDVKIAVSAIRQIVEEAVSGFEGVTSTRTSIQTSDDVIKIDVECVIAGGAHVPTVTLNIQRSIREYVETNCGIAVKSVDVTVTAVDGVPNLIQSLESGKLNEAARIAGAETEEAAEGDPEETAVPEETASEPEVADDTPAEDGPAAAQEDKETAENDADALAEENVGDDSTETFDPDKMQEQ